METSSIIKKQVFYILCVSEKSPLDATDDNYMTREGPKFKLKTLLLCHVTQLNDAMDESAVFETAKTKLKEPECKNLAFNRQLQLLPQNVNKALILFELMKEFISFYS